MQPITVILGLLVAWFIGYETGKYMTTQKFNTMMRNIGKQLQEAAEKLKQEEAKKRDEINKGI